MPSNPDGACMPIMSTSTPVAALREVRRSQPYAPFKGGLIGLAVLAGLAFLRIRSPLASAGSPDEPAPPVAMM